MSLRRTLAITRRLLAQFRHDHRTLALLFVAPLVILFIFSLLFENGMSPASLGLSNQDHGPLGAQISETARARRPRHGLAWHARSARRGAVRR